MIERKEYLDFLIKLKDKKIIKVVTGIRRCGKSTLFKLYRDYLLENGIKKEQIISYLFFLASAFFLCSVFNISFLRRIDKGVTSTNSSLFI